MFGWHDGKRENCEKDECREWIERDMLVEWKKRRGQRNVGIQKR